MNSNRGPGLYEFLIEAELQHYYSTLRNDLKIHNVPQLKYVSDEDLVQIGMSKPEMRRLKKFFQKYYPQNYISKIKKMILPKKGEEQFESMIAMLPDDTGPDGRPPVKVPNKHIIPADNIIVNKELGTGEFGVVQQGVWTNDGERIQVAIKCLSREKMGNNPIEFLKEAAIMHGIDHEHIVRLYGVVLDTNALMLVTELAPLRSLLECLKEPSLRSNFPVLTLCDFAIQICDGMQYLEIKRLIHRDLAARNILVFSKNKVKISDFGLSRALGVGKDYYQTNFNVNLKLPIAWCAPECISYLRFTSASDVWAYGVTLWEMFSYGFQPWAALTGHQILEAIDEPKFQRLEQPDCCPKEYYNLMLKCWQHEPSKRPKFCDLMNLLPECKPEQVQAVHDSYDEKIKCTQLQFKTGDIITVLDKGPLVNCWKGVLNSGKTGFFNPANTVAYLGSNLPCNKNDGFTRGSTNTLYSSKRNKIRPDMISCPQGDVKHTGHVGLDGAYFGDISFLGGSSKYNHLPHQVVTPYKPQEDLGLGEPSPVSKCSDRAPLLTPDHHSSAAHVNQSLWLDYDSATATLKSNKTLSDHEYHEISDDDKDKTVAESPRFEKHFDFELGPSLLDEMDAMFRNLGSDNISPPPSPLDPSDSNKRNELREIVATASMHISKKKKHIVKPISAADEKSIDSAIAFTKEVTDLTMNDMNNSHETPPVTPASPTKHKFSFRFHSPQASLIGPSTSRAEGKTFADEAASLPDIHNCLTEEAKAAYSTLVEQPAVESNPLRMLRATPIVKPKVRGNKHLGSLGASCEDSTDFTSSHSEGNAIPLPPRDRTRPSSFSNKARHQRKHPLIIPGEGLTRTLAKMADTPPTSPVEEPSYLGLEEDTPTAGPSSTFDDQIASDIEALDNLECSTPLHHSNDHVSCEDLLEFSKDTKGEHSITYNTYIILFKTKYALNNSYTRICGKSTFLTVALFFCEIYPVSTYITIQRSNTSR